MRRTTLWAPRLIVCVLLAVYGCLFVVHHRMETNTSTPHVVRVTNPLVRISKDIPPSKNITETLFPIPLNWKNGLSEGRIDDYTKDLWEYTNLPRWMKDYFLWHKNQRAELLQNPETWNTIRYYLVECSRTFDNCGGAADRLGPIPLHLRMAATHRRFLLISWRDDRPAPLEEFLLPPLGGIDWRVPEWLWTKFHQPKEKRRIATFMGKIESFGSDPTVRWLRVKLQSHDAGEHEFDRRRKDGDDPSFSQVYHDVWRIFFTPSPPIAQRIQSEMQNLGLILGEYVSIHVRALYAVETRDENLIRWWAQASINCATSNLKVGGSNHVSPILFVSDSIIAKEEAISYASRQGIPLVVRLQNQHEEPLHLEKDNSTNILDYYDTFVDILMIGMGHCTAYSMGGFGRWGSMISYNSSCNLRMGATMVDCERPLEASSSFQDNHIDTSQNISPLFIPPMAVHVNENYGNLEPAKAEEDEASVAIFGSTSVDHSFNFSHLSFALDETLYEDRLVYEKFDSVKFGVNLWERSRKLPVWMKKYFKWHRKQRRHVLNPQNWTSMRLLVVECLQHQPKCGGTSDRLKPIPTLLRIAASTQRFLMIHWTRPCRLEEFLLPPKGGMDWRVPEWLHPLLIDYGDAVTLVDSVRDTCASKSPCVRTRYQSYDGGQGWYNEQLKRNETAFNEVFHDVWRVLFTPSPPVAAKIKHEMTEKGLAPGEYGAAHLRALYDRDGRSAGQTRIWTRNALNCTTQLRPGKPIFFASDSKIASDFSVVYGERMNGIVVTHQNHPDPPLHLDKAENFSDMTVARRPVSDYHDTFIDLYLIALSRCVYISKGGFGHWGLLIGGNTSCVMKLKRGKNSILNPCNWATPSNSSLETTRATLTEPLFLEPEW